MYEWIVTSIASAHVQQEVIREVSLVFCISRTFSSSNCYVSLHLCIR